MGQPAVMPGLSQSTATGQASGTMPIMMGQQTGTMPMMMNQQTGWSSMVSPFTQQTMMTGYMGTMPMQQQMPMQQVS